MAGASRRRTRTIEVEYADAVKPPGGGKSDKSGYLATQSPCGRTALKVAVDARRCAPCGLVPDLLSRVSDGLSNERRVVCRRNSFWLEDQREKRLLCLWQSAFWCLLHPGISVRGI